jgi:hypothetical protein
MEVTRRHVMRILREAGLPEVAEEAERILPDPVPYEQAESLLAQHGITRDELVSRHGGSP